MLIVRKDTNNTPIIYILDQSLPPSEMEIKEATDWVCGFGIFFLLGIRPPPHSFIFEQP